MNTARGRVVNRQSMVSAPLKALVQKGLLVGRVLDYGSGRGTDADKLGMEKYDPHYHSTRPKGKFDTVVSSYVLNVIHPVNIDDVVSDMYDLLKDGGKAYIAVRRDIKQEGYTSTGTLQHHVVLNLPVESRMAGKFVIYRLER